jgi:hypothetical protein
MAKAKKLTSKQVGLTYGFRSGLEETIAAQLKSAGIDPKFETLKLPYRVEKNHTYTPDFPVGKRIIIETKGRFQTADRMKMLEVKKQHPEYEFRFIFNNSKSKISKVSATTYGKWCEKNGFKYADKVVPQEWIEEILKEK